MRPEVKNLFKSVNADCTFMKRLSDKKADRYKKDDIKLDALEGLRDACSEIKISSDLKLFLTRRIVRTWSGIC